MAGVVAIPGAIGLVLPALGRQATGDDPGATRDVGAERLTHTEEDVMESVTSKDGTPIAYERSGVGPAVILVGGGLDDGTENAPLVPPLSRRFTVVNYARRGRGESGDTQPYSIEREFEGLEALIETAGGSASLYGVSSGGALALEAAAAGVRADKVAVYEVPYNMASDWPQRWMDYRGQLAEALANDRRDDASSCSCG
jgi:pimeloyl-ACP methyl ester carboxylesterase